jgi:hypothetical protein
MRFRTLGVAWMLAVAWLAAGTLWAAASVSGKDKIILKEQPEDPKEGTIKSDDIKGVSITLAAGPTMKFDRDKVARVIYANANSDGLQKAVDKVNEGGYDEALKILEDVGKGLQNLSNEQKPMFNQYVLYYRGMCWKELAERDGNPPERKKKLDAAQAAFESLVANSPESAFVFETDLMRGRCIEMLRGRGDARAHYERLIKEWPAKFEGASEKYVFLARLAILRLGMEDATKGLGNEDKVRNFYRDLNGAVKGAEKSIGPAEKAEVARIETTALLYLKEYDKLVAILNGSIRQAVKDDDREILRGLYLSRADASYELMKANEKDEAKKKDFAQRAMLDYLRASLNYDLAADQDCRANLRLGELLLFARPAEWKNHALDCLQKAKNLNQQSQAAAIEEALKKVRETDEAGAKKDEPKKDEKKDEPKK